ncbi:MAG: tRNA lysidine(34) synthetase TilS [Deltaproteobacteria bacterium]|nr:tRNA lysidine(34) synthetase TilS [Deltaproteobacteria bacterium]
MVLQELERAIRRLDLAGRRVLVAVSGGVDSTVLVVGLAELARLHRLELTIGHVNHGLRGAESTADEHAVRTLAGKLGVPVAVETIDPHALRSEGPSRDRPTLQEAARTLRYRALRALCARFEAAPIATAHNADDQAETVLLRLLRGTGPDGLGGIPEQSPDAAVVRPLLLWPILPKRSAGTRNGSKHRFSARRSSGSRVMGNGYASTSRTGRVFQKHSRAGWPASLYSAAAQGGT